MATNVARQIESRWKNLLGFKIESAFDTFVAADKWLPVAGSDAIERTTEMLKVDAPLGQLLPRSTGYDAFGLSKGKLTVKMDAVPLSNNVVHLLAEIFSNITTTGDLAPYTHVLKVRDVSLYALNQAVGLSFTEVNDAFISKLSGCRATGLKITQEQNGFMKMEIEYEGATHAVDAIGANAPSITLLTACPFYKFSHAIFKVATVAVPITSFSMELKLKTTTGDNVQPLGTAGRTKLDHVGLDPVKITVKRAYAFDGTNQSTYEADYLAGTARAIQMAWTYTVAWSFTIDATAARLMEKPKRSIVDGVVMEELTYECRDNGTDEPVTVTVKDDNETPATRTWS